MLSKEKLEEFRRLLEDRLKELLEEASKTLTGMSNSEESFPDVSDRASFESDRSFMLRLRDRERKLIGKIKEALERIENGTYGICEQCGKEISEERLRIRPVTTLCIECKKKQEREEKIKGI
ncbi:MAG TPA: RNA polymerase-binding protein DksA [Desulfobacteraceae bacterium]|nr:RNA polymerase-binding protein DksA [Desulfobacteraceae bacterium]